MTDWLHVERREAPLIVSIPHAGTELLDYEPRFVSPWLARRDADWHMPQLYAFAAERGATIVRTFEFKDFPAAIKFVAAVAALAEQAWHHPDIDIRWNKVTLTLSTHDAGGLTEKDFALARQFDQL